MRRLTERFNRLFGSRGNDVRVKLGQSEMVLSFVRTFSDVPVGKPLLYIDSRGHLGLAINQDNFSQVYQVNPPVEIFIPRKAN